MCKLLIGVSHAPSQKFDALISLQRETMKEEPHGIAAYINTPDKTNVFRALTGYKPIFEATHTAVIQAIEAHAPIIASLHTRTTSSGAISEENVHYFEDKGLLMAHNGFASEFGRWAKVESVGYQTGFRGWESGAYGKVAVKVKPAPEQELEKLWDTVEECDDCENSAEGFCARHISICNRINKLAAENPELGAMQPLRADAEASDPSDTLQMLRAITRPVTLESLAKDVATASFSGVAFLVDKDAKKGFLIASREIGVHTDWKTYSIFYSYKPESEFRTLKSLPKLSHIKIPLPHKERKETVYSLEPGIYEIPLFS